MTIAKPPATIVVDWGAEEPVYSQIARQIRARIADGELPAGTTLPGVRVLAGDLGLNLNTVARAYRLLEDEGFVSIRDRSGAEVSPPRGSADPALRERLADELRQLLLRMRQAGLATSDLRRLAEKEIAALGAQAPGQR